MIAVADTGPINYLIVIGEIELLPSLYQRVFLPISVQQELHAGERDVILLAEELRNAQVIIDKFRGRREAQRRQLLVTGALGVLAAASKKGLVNPDRAPERLGQTSFRISRDILDSIRQTRNIP